MKSIEDLYGISTYDIDPLDLKECKTNARAELHKAQVQFQQQEADYQKYIRQTIELLFNHKNTIAIDDEDLMPRVLKRKIYKRAPFHKELKESYGVGTITETLINIKHMVQINAEDKIYFVTGNYKDFADTENNDNLHPHIVDDLKTEGLESHVIYIRSFGNLIYPNLKPNIENANLAEEENYYQELEDAQRESAGLTALGEFINRLEEGIPESDFATVVVEQFERLNKAYGMLEELSFFYEDELDIDSLDCSDLVSKFADVVGCGSDPTVENLKINLEWIETQKRICSIRIKSVHPKVFKKLKKCGIIEIPRTQEEKIWEHKSSTHRDSSRMQ